MSLHEDQELKKEFQLERIILFSDAVFAIIITIMVIELKLPETVREMTTGSPEMTHALKGIIFKLTGYLLSFFLISRFWMSHLKIFSFLKDYDRGLLAFNLFFLFCVSLFPFSITLITGALRMASKEYGWGMCAYITTFFLCTFAQSLLTRYLIKHKDTLCYSPDVIETELRWRSVKFMMISAVLFFVILVVSIIFDLDARLYGYIVISYGIINGIVARRLYPMTDRPNKPFILRMFARRQKKAPKAKANGDK